MIWGPFSCVAGDIVFILSGFFLTLCSERIAAKKRKETKNLTVNKSPHVKVTYVFDGDM